VFEDLSVLRISIFMSVLRISTFMSVLRISIFMSVLSISIFMIVLIDNTMKKKKDKQRFSKHS
jgi:predicted membrane protein